MAITCIKISELSWKLSTRSSCQKINYMVNYVKQLGLKWWGRESSLDESQVSNQAKSPTRFQNLPFCLRFQDVNRDFKIFDHKISCLFFYRFEHFCWKGLVYGNLIFVTVRMKTSLVHISDLTTLRACKNCLECLKWLIFAAVIKWCWIYKPSKYELVMSFLKGVIIF